MFDVEINYVRVRMRDGVELAVKITRPDSEGEFPGVLEYHPYRRIKKALPDYRDEQPPVVPYLAERGYAIVQCDVRGTGNSGGWSTDIYSAEERQDGYDMVEWIAAQPWCNGCVGMIGKSYGAVVQWQVAVQNPPHLKAVIVRSANDDVYTEWTYPGGALRPYMFDSYSPLMTAWNFSPPDPDIVGEKWSAIWQERLDKSRPWGIGYIAHPLGGPYWRERSLAPDYGRVKCAVFVIAGWADCYPTALLRAYSKITSPKRALVGPWGHWYGEERHAVPGPRIDTRPDYLKWFDFWLKGIDNGVMEEPPVTLFVKRYSPPSARMPIEERGAWRSEKEWPIARTGQSILYFRTHGELRQERPQVPRCRTGKPAYDEFTYDPTVGTTSGIHWGGGILPWGTPVDQRPDEALSLVYSTPPLEDDLEVTGTPTAILYVSSTADVAYFRVKLSDVAPNGISKLVRYGGLNATHRASHANPEPLIPGQVYELRVGFKTMSYVFEAGHRIRIAVSGADFLNAWPTAKAAVNTVHRSDRYPSHIVIPVVAKQNPLLPEPSLERLANAEPGDLATPAEYSISRDLVNETASVYISPVHVRSSEGSRLEQRSVFTVSRQNPADAFLTASCVYSEKSTGMEIRVEANEQTVSDEATFRHVVQVEIQVNGSRHFHKSWSVTVPRRLN